MRGKTYCPEVQTEQNETDLTWSQIVKPATPVLNVRKNGRLTTTPVLKLTKGQYKKNCNKKSNERSVQV